MSKHNIYIIAAVDQNHGIGKNKDLPWNFKKDLSHFRKITTTTKDPNKTHMLIMGDTTWKSIPEKFRPFKKRKNTVLSWNKGYKADGAEVFDSIDEALDSAGDDVEDIFFIGGGMVYKQAMEHPRLTGVYLTRIQKTFDCDTFFSKIPKDFSKETLLGEEEEDGVVLKYYLYEKG